MTEIGPEHPLSYRSDVVGPFFRLLRAGDSCAVVSPASMGKSRLCSFILRPDVQAHYLGDQAPLTMFALADCHRLADVSEWGLYELLLTALVEASGRLPAAAGARGLLVPWRSEVILGGNALLARRNTELAAQVLCHEHGIKLCLILDEFDAVYAQLPARGITNLRALRDANKYSLTYLLLLRQPLARLRDPGDCEGFNELFPAPAILGLKPYADVDARRVLAQMQARKQVTLAPETEAEVMRLSGNHPGLLTAVFDVICGEAEDPAGQIGSKPQVREECRKLWHGLAQDEQLALSRLVQGIGIGYAAGELLTLKGLLRPGVYGGQAIFSPLFEEYVRSSGTVSEKALWLDEQAASVTVEGLLINDLPPLELRLLSYLYRNLGKVCSRGQLIEHLYHEGESGIADSRIDSLVRHLRKRIEPSPGQPRYVLSVRGQGYRLVDTPEPEAAGPVPGGSLPD